MARARALGWNTLGRSVHGSPEPAPEADYSVLAPIFAPGTNQPGAAKQPIGLEALRQFRAREPGWVLALGGISPVNLDSVLEAGADGIASISLVFAARERARENVEAVVRAFARRVPDHGSPT